MAAGQNWSNTDSQYLSNNTLSKELRTVGQPMFRYRQFSEPYQEFGRKGGKKFLFTRQGNANATTDGAYLNELQPVPRTNVSFNQGELTVFEHGLAIPHSELFDTVSEFEVQSQVIVNALVNNMARNIDLVCYNEGCNTGDVVYTPTGTDANPTATWAVNGTAGAAATRQAQVWDVKNWVDAFNWGVYGSTFIAPAEPQDGENFVTVGSIPMLRSISDDPAWENAQYYGDPEKLFSGEKGRIYQDRLVADNHIAGRLTTTTYTDECTVFAKDAVREGVCTAEEVRDNIPTDFQRDRASAWYSLNGFCKEWPVSAGDNRIIRVRSL